MNTFANTLFSAMLGWVRSIVSGVFSIVQNGDISSFFRWLAGNWLPLAATIIIVGIALDLLVWIVRWRPHYVWLSTFRSIHTKRQNKQKRREEQEFESGYNEGMEYEFFKGEPEPMGLDNPELPQEVYSLPAIYQLPGYYGIPGQDYASGMQADVQPARDGGYDYYPIQGESDAVISGETPAQTGPPVRRRRSDQHKPRLFGTISKVGKQLFGGAPENRQNGALPPPIAKKDAFYDPVYPSREPLDSGRQPTRAMPLLGQPKDAGRGNGNGK
jgi:hypothetical protein